jgi:2-polyprenyl-6-methoxyphenol hydroxylase-like FAD-dependent oxidoreductase
MSDAPVIPVVIVGGGPVGLALAGDLGWRGVPCLLIEQGDGAIYQPKMDLVGIRTMEQCRRWGIVGEVEAAPYPRDYPQDNIYLTSLTGYELGREPFPGMGGETPPPASPQKRERCPQNMFDPILRRFAGRFPTTEIRTHTKLVGFAQTADQVSAEIEDTETGRRESLTARYLVGCDGFGSLVRESLGIEMRGTPVLTYTTNIIFRCAELVSLHDKGRGYRHIFIGPEGTWATIVAINGGDQWRMSLIGSSARKEYSIAEIHAAIRRAVGRDFAYEILTVVPWARRELIAERYGAGRVYLAGDAVHVMSPTGGYGMNTGIGDAVDLAWKLAALIEGYGGPGLLEAYQIERRPVAERNVTEASGNLRRMLSPGVNPDIEDDSAAGARTRARVGAAFSDAMRNEWFTLGIHLGYRYEASPICWPDGTPPQAYETSTYIPTTRPGARAPHVWLADGRSTLDLFGRGFVLLRLGEDAPDPAPVAKAAAAVGVPLAVVEISEPAVVKAYERRLVLMRPDGHVAWRGDGLPPDPAILVDCVRGVTPWAWRAAAPV